MVKGPNQLCLSSFIEKKNIPRLISILCLHLIGYNWVTWLETREAEKYRNVIKNLGIDPAIHTLPP